MMPFFGFVISFITVFGGCTEPNPMVQDPPVPEKIVQWKWSSDISKYQGELQRDPILFKDWVIIGYASDYRNLNPPLMIAFDKRTGEKVWEYYYPNQKTSDCYNIKLVNDLIVVTFKDRIVCLQAENRALVWEKIISNKERIPYACEVYGAYLYISEDYFDDPRDFPFNDSVTLVRYHVPTGTSEKLYGERRQKNTSKHPEIFPPVVYKDGDRELVIFTRNYLDPGGERPVDKIAIDIKTKEIVWMDTMYSHLSAAWNTPPYIYNGNVIAASDYHMYCWRASDGKQVWKTELTGLNKLAGFSFSGPFLHGNRMYGVSNEGKIFCVDAANGRLVWQNVKVGNNDNGPARGPCNRPIIVGNIMYINSWSDQAFVLIDTYQGKQLERYRDYKYNGRNVLYDEETQTFFVTANEILRAFTVKK